MVRFDGSQLRTAVANSPIGEQVVAIAVDVALHHLRGDSAEARQLVGSFHEEDAQRLSRSLQHFFATGSFPRDATFQSIMDSDSFRRWLTTWLPNFLRTVDSLSPNPRTSDAQLLEWLRTGNLPSYRGNQS